MTEADPVTLAQLSQKMAELAHNIDALSQGGALDNVAGIDAEQVSARPCQAPGAPAMRIAKPALPDPELVRKIIRQRQRRSEIFGAEMFADPAWDMLLDLAAAHAENHRVSVTSLCIASGVPNTTALRWINQMVGQGLLERVQDDIDKRRAFVSLTARSREAIARYFDAISERPALAA